MPNPRKPHGLKLVQGTARKDRTQLEPEFPVSTNPQPPEWVVQDDAKKEWHRIVGLLTATNVLTDADLSTLGHLCNLHSSVVLMWKLGGSPHAAQLTQLRLYYAEFGLSPASRGKAQPVGTGKKKNGFKELTG